MLALNFGVVYNEDKMSQRVKCCVAMAIHLTYLAKVTDVCLQLACAAARYRMPWWYFRSEKGEAWRMSKLNEKEETCKRRWEGEITM